MRRFRLVNRCPHSALRGIYGDEINYTGGYRLWCLTCHRFIDGPVALAEIRRGELAAAARGEYALLHADDCDRILGCTCGTRTEIPRGSEQE